MADRRERILARLVDVLNTVAELRTVVRNKMLVSDTKFPVAQLFDGDEEADESDPANRPSHAPRRMVMTPEIYVTLGGKPEDVGTKLNALRAAVLKAVLTDSELVAIVGGNGHIRVRACANGLTESREMQGAVGVSISFHYPMIPAEL